MVNTVSRRHILAVGAGGLASLPGCQAVLGSEVSISIYVLNSTEQNLDAYLELTRPDDETFHRGRVLPVEKGIAETVNFTVPAGTYQMMLNIDDVEPRPERTVEWRITDDECVRQRYWTISSSEIGLNLHSVKPDCNSSG